MQSGLQQEVQGATGEANGEVIMSVVVKSSKKVFTAEEISVLTGICLEHLRAAARNKHLGFISSAAQAAGQQVEAAGKQVEAASRQVEEWLFTNSDLMVLTVLHPRCEH
jgi:hypothetical protein